jgi:acetyl-CoA carboxylase alpha subunit
MPTYLDFEKPIAELETRLAELRETASGGAVDIDAEIGKLDSKTNKLLRDSGRISRITSPASPTISWPSRATGRLRTIRRSLAVSRALTAGA